MIETACTQSISDEVQSYSEGKRYHPLLLCGDAQNVLRELPSKIIDCCLTSPPYWGQRQYATAGIGLEDDFKRYIQDLAAICGEIKRVLKDTGSLWLNIGDTYQTKGLLGIPWRIALELIDKQGWILRNDVIWNKVKGGLDNSKDKLRNVHEHVFHFVKEKSYYYDADSIRSNPRKSKVINGAIVSATGVSGVRYKRQIELSTNLSDNEKLAAFSALDLTLQEIVEGKLADFRMIIRGQQRTTHSDSERVSGRAKELRDKGFYFLKYDPNGSKPSDVWDILPEDTHNRESHFAPFPEDLCKIPILATCPQNGIVLDPFCGTGTTNLVAFQFGRKSIGIDVAAEYIKAAEARCNFLL
jgi:site-specific DNA-methyltransferase (adenine-specific)